MGFCLVSIAEGKVPCSNCSAKAEKERKKERKKGRKEGRKKERKKEGKKERKKKEKIERHRVNSPPQ